MSTSHPSKATSGNQSSDGAIKRPTNQVKSSSPAINTKSGATRCASIEILSLLLLLLLHQHLLHDLLLLDQESAHHPESGSNPNTRQQRTTTFCKRTARQQGEQDETINHAPATYDAQARLWSTTLIVKPDPSLPTHQALAALHSS